LLVAGVALTTGSAAGDAAASKRVETIAFMRLVNGPIFGGRLFVVRADGSGLRRVTPRSTMIDSYGWSPNGRLIAYIDQRFSVWLVRPDGTGRRLLLPTSRLSSEALSWSPDGKGDRDRLAGSKRRRTTQCAQLGSTSSRSAWGSRCRCRRPAEGSAAASPGLPRR
jgi:hypothetical protein